ncbi:MAG TPA: ABC transporter permease [Chthoniobacterales bacterium]
MSAALSFAVVEHRRRGKGFWATFLPPFLWMAGFYLIPLAVLLSLAFQKHEYVRIVHEFTWENFSTALSPAYRPALIRTLYVASMVTFVDMIIALPAAYFLAFHAGRWKALLTVLILLPLWSSYLVRVFAWRIILGKVGILNWLLIQAGILDKPSPIFVYNLFSMGLTLCYIWLPFMILPLVTAFERLPRNLLEASSDLGADGLTTFRRVTLPLIMPGLLAGALSVFSLTSGDYITPALIGGPGDSLVGNIIAGQFGVASNYPLGSAISALVLAVLFVLMAILAKKRVLENL